MQEFQINEETNLEGVRAIAAQNGIFRTSTSVHNWLKKGVIKGRQVAPRTFVIEPQTVRLRRPGKPKREKS